MSAKSTALCMNLLRCFHIFMSFLKRMNSYRFSDVIFVKIRLIFILYNADTEIERVKQYDYQKNGK